MIWTLRDDQGNRWIGGVPLACAEALANIGKILRTDDPRVRERLMPETFSDPDDQDQWERYAQPELLRLFAGRLEVVEADLKTLRPLRDASADLFIDAAGKGGADDGAGSEDGDPEQGEDSNASAGSFLDHLANGNLSEDGLGLFHRDAYIFKVGRGHEAAWLATLNAARHALFLLHGLDPMDMERHHTEFRDKGRLEAMWQIDMLGQLQLMLIEE